MILKRYSQQDEAFLRRIVFAEEDRQLFTTASWRGEYRWFRSPNVVPIEYWRRPTADKEMAVKSA
jgi:hypothetical protein